MTFSQKDPSHYIDLALRTGYRVRCRSQMVEEISPESDKENLCSPLSEAPSFRSHLVWRGQRVLIVFEGPDVQGGFAIPAYAASTRPAELAEASRSASSTVHDLDDDVARRVDQLEETAKRQRTGQFDALDSLPVAA